MKTTVIHHSADYDGIFCREIARKFLPDAELIGWDFADKPLQVPEGVVYVLDLPLDATFGGKPGEFNMGVMEAVTSNQLFWIDHHASAIKSHPSECGGYRIDGVAACRLAWFYFTALGRYKAQTTTADFTWFQGHYPWATKEEFVCRKLEEPVAVRLAGEYDIWDKRDPNAELFQHGLRSRELTPGDWSNILSIPKPSVSDIERMIGDGITHHLLNPDGTSTPEVVWQLLEAGRGIQYAQRKQDEFVAKNRSFDVEFEGLKFMAINAVRCNSLTFEAATRPDHDALMGFFYNGKEWTVSMYHAPHRKDLDLSAIAVRYGGGGHKGACGFRAKSLPFIST